jgi:predicted dehydrogenase
VDVVLLESVDGRIHLQEATQVIKAGKPLFIDKPVAGSLVDAIAIDELAREHNVPYFSSSSSRFGPGLQDLKNGKDVGTLAGAAVWGPCSYQPNTPDLTFYGVHGIEALVNLMGTGCESVSRIQARDADLVTCVWKGGRVGTYRGIRQNKAAFGAIAFGTKGIVQAKQWGDYKDLCNEIATFFKTRKPPFSSAETLEIMAIIEAADQSKDKGGAPVSLADVVAKARAELATKNRK